MLLSHEKCNPYGAETDGGRMLGGMGGPPTTRWYCQERSVYRFRLICEHEHRGPIMPLCQTHYTEFSERTISFCPRCNINDDHKCNVQLIPLS